MHRELAGGVFVHGGPKACAGDEVALRVQQGVLEFAFLHRPGHRRVHSAGRLLPHGAEAGAQPGGEAGAGSACTGSLRAPSGPGLARSSPVYLLSRPVTFCAARAGIRHRRSAARVLPVGIVAETALPGARTAQAGGEGPAADQRGGRRPTAR